MMQAETSRTDARGALAGTSAGTDIAGTGRRGGAQRRAVATRRPRVAGAASSRRPGPRRAGPRPAVRPIAKPGTEVPTALAVGRGRRSRSVEVSPRGVARAGRVPRETRVLRLTARGRLVVVALTLLALAGALLVATGGASSAGESGRSVVQPVVVVQPGQTLWELARRVAPGVDPRTTVAQIRELNSLPSATVMPGQRLAVPVR